MGQVTKKTLILKPKPQYTAAQIIADLEKEIHASLQEATAQENEIQAALQEAGADSFLETGDVRYDVEANFPEVDTEIIIIIIEFASRAAILTYQYILDRLRKRGEVDEGEAGDE